MALISNEFFVHLLKQSVWKNIHMLVYIAYLSIIFHIFLGTLRFETNVAYFIFIISCISYVLLLHLFVALKEYQTDRIKAKYLKDSYILVGHIEYLKENKGKVVRGNMKELPFLKAKVVYMPYLILALTWVAP